MSPPDSSVYAEYLFNLGLVGESERDKLLKWEDNMKYHASVGQYQQAWEVKSEGKKQEIFENLPLIKDPHFLSDHY